MLIKFYLQVIIMTLSISTVLFSQNELKTISVKNQKTSLEFSKIENEIFKEINYVRTKPIEYIAHLNNLKKYIKGKILSRPKQTAELLQEGIPAVDEAISILKNTTPLHSLKTSKGLTKVAENQLKDLQENPKLGHFGKDGSDLLKRLEKVGKINQTASENLSFRIKKSRHIILRMVTDDGVKARSHRKNILNPDFNFIGIACGEDKNSMMICVMVFADSFKEKSKTKPIPIKAF